MLYCGLVTEVLLYQVLMLLHPYCTCKYRKCKCISNVSKSLKKTTKLFLVRVKLLTRTFFLLSLFALCQHPCTLRTVFFQVPAIVLPFPSQMGGASSYSTQFLSHSSPRGPPPGMVSPRPGPPPTSGGLYPSHPAQTQKMSQHGGYPGGQQGLKRPFHSEVSEKLAHHWEGLLRKTPKTYYQT